ncbi:hypothetical protein [Amycolatopsis sp. w19]|uniref:hypothetical protein n=1 Tax=Amycolatopsis sp. w19 TaxID=3448134 RepID=UPI003F1AD78E
MLIGVNIPGSGLLREGRHDPRTGHWAFPPPHHPTAGEDPATQTERRFDLVHHLRLFAASAGMLTGGTLPEYLFRRTGGVVGLLERLIEEGCAEAIATGTETLTEDLLDEVLVELGNDPTRDAAAGEIPPSPAHTPRRRRRNTVFDDRGVPLGQAASPGA